MPEDDAAPYQFKRDGDAWLIRFNEEKHKLWDAQFHGLEHIARLLQKPYEAVPVEELTQVKDVGETSTKPHQTDNAFDPEGRGNVRAQAQRLADQAADARLLGHHQKAAEYVEALEVLKKHHDRDKRQDGQPRRINKSATGRAAECIRQAINAVCKKLKNDSCEQLAAHIKAHIHKNGTTFIYTPTKPPPSWDILPMQPA